MRINRAQEAMTKQDGISLASRCQDCKHFVILLYCEMCCAHVCGKCWCKHYARHTGRKATL